MAIYRSPPTLSPSRQPRGRVERLSSGSEESLGEKICSGEEDDVDEQGRLLGSDHGHVGSTTAEASPVSHRRPWWPLAALSFACVVTIIPLSWLLLSLNLPGRSQTSRLEAALSVPLRRPDEDYVLAPNWNSGASSQVRAYDWIIVDKEGDPDGIRKPMMTINGQFPGPLIEVNEGDVVQVNVRNLASNATAIHWHGIFQNGTNWMDGAVGVTQCPIAPGGSYRYKFNVTGQAGTYFYHGHQGVQALSGLVGPLVVHRRDEATHHAPYSSDRVVLLQDWYYDLDSSLMRDVLSPGVEDAPTPNTALINGVNQANCSNHPSRPCSDADKPFPNLDLTPGQSHRLRFLNVGAFAWFQVAVDEHDYSLQIIEVDSTTVEPIPNSEIVIAPGQRYSAILTTDQINNEAFWLRARMIKTCLASQTLPENGIDEAKAIIRYRTPTERRESDDVLPLPTTFSRFKFLPTCRDMSSMTSFSPSPALPAPAYADHSWYMRVNLAIGDWRLQRGVMNSSSFRPNLKSPTLHRMLDGLAENNESFTKDGILDTAFDPTSELVISHNGVSETVDIVLQNMDENSHPFHLHGTQMWVLGQGHGYFPGYNILDFKDDGKGLLFPESSNVVDNPLRRDTVTAEGFGWVLLRFVADNPGVWLFHCHVAWHSEAGMGMQFVSRTDSMREWKLPEEARRLCDAPEEDLMKGASPKDEEFFGFDKADGQT